MDPETGERGPRRVDQVWIHPDTVLDLKVAAGVITTTEDHPFWNDTDHEFQRADQLDKEDQLLTADGRPVQVVGIQPASQRATTAYNLSINDIHTYYVLAGKTPVLVHNSCHPETLIHYTDEAGMNGIVGSKKLNASTKEAGPKDAKYGAGQYLSDIAPGTKTCAQLSRCFLGHPFSAWRFTDYVEIDVRGLNVVKGRDGVYVVPNQGPLDLGEYSATERTEMRYLKVRWRHDLPGEPVELYSELDDAGHEIRKVEIYRDGRREFADSESSSGTTTLGEGPLPSLDEIAEQEEFSPSLIEVADFERVWRQAVGGSSSSW